MCVPVTETIQVPSSVLKVKFSQLSGSGENALASIVKDYGVVYVTSITRDGCSGCMEQKPLYEDLARKVSRDQKGKTVFNNIHVHYENNDSLESEQAKKTLRHIAYPTYMIHLKSRFGVLEAYRAVYPKMEDLEKQVIETIETADFYKTDHEKHAV